MAFTPTSLQQLVSQIIFLSFDPVYMPITSTFQSKVWKILAREVKVKQSLYKVREALRFRRGCGSQISRQLAQEGGKVFMFYGPCVVILYQ